MRVLVIGASGFVGRRVVDALAHCGWARPIAAYHRRRPAVAATDAISLDASDPDDLGDALGRVDAVVNAFAGSPAATVREAQALVLSMRRLQSPPRLVHLSSMAVYGAARGVVDERTPLVGTASGYGAGKVAAEAILSHYANAVILRPSCVYGPASIQWSERMMRLLIQRRLGDLGVAGTGCCNLIYIDDLVDAILCGLRGAELAGTQFNISMPSAPTWNEYFAATTAALGIAPMQRIPACRLLAESFLLAPFVEVVARLSNRTSSPRPGIVTIPPSLRRLFKQAIQLDSSRAERAFGLHWTPLELGLQKSVEAFRRTSQNAESLRSPT